MVLWKVKQNQQTSDQAHQEEKRKDPNEKTRNERREITTKTTEIQKNHKRILWTIICQQIGQPRRNGHISRNIQPTKTESGRNR